MAYTHGVQDVANDDCTAPEGHGSGSGGAPDGDSKKAVTHTDLG